MALLRELRIRARTVLPAVAGLLALSYFAYHAVNGDRGLLAHWRLQESLQVADAERSALDSERQTLEHQVALMRADNLSRDMVQERARLLLGHIMAREVVIFDDQAADD